jgi:predicted small secreted protein
MPSDSRRRAVWIPGLLALFLMAGALGACNTVQGLGEDTEAAGRAITGASEDVEDDI